MGAHAIPDAPVCALDWFESPVGPLVAAATRDGICLLEFSDRERLSNRLETLRKRYAGSLSPGPNHWLGDLRKQLTEYFDSERQQFELPLIYPGSPFQEKVWSMLRQIPYGQTWSYIDVATRIGDVLATRAVGAANGQNPIAIVIPCHRVINANGDFGGYGGGVWRKRILLDLERGQGRLPF